MSDKQKQPDPRHAPIRELIGDLYQEANGLPAPWNGHTATVLASFLKANRGWPVDALLRCVRNRFASENTNLSEDPIRWINKLCNYVRAPLNKFGEPIRGYEQRYEPAKPTRTPEEEYALWRADVMGMIQERLRNGVPLERCKDLTQLCDKSMLAEIEQSAHRAIGSSGD